jgi:hypothetical protein
LLFYNKTTDITTATHLYIYGTRGQKEIIQLIHGTPYTPSLFNIFIDKVENESMTCRSVVSRDRLQTRPWFEFRFTKYNYSEASDKFVPCQFDYYKPFSHLISTYQDGVKEGISYDNIVDKYGK